MMTSLKKYLLPLLLMLVTLFSSCDEDWIPAEVGMISFSKDTLSFDTVFTTVGSATARILVYNRQKEEVLINSVHLAGGAASVFRINVDGQNHVDHQFQDVYIRGGDSLYIFVEVRVNPQNQDAPMVHVDSILFEMREGRQRILLEAVGQDMILLLNDTISSSTSLDADRPYLVKGDLVVDSAVTLTLPAGCRMYFYHNANLMVHGNLQVEGTLEKPVLMRGSRLDAIGYSDPVPYHYVAGQWGGVYLTSSTGNHSINYLQLSSGSVGLYFYNSDRRFKPTLQISNSRIHNFRFYNLVAVNGDVDVSNTEISNSGSYTVYLNGGKHTFYHCTISNFFNFNAAQAVNRDQNPAVMIMELNRSLSMETIFKNCIVTGSQSNEFTLAGKMQEQYKGDFSHSYIRKADTTLTQFSQIRWYQYSDTLFVRNRYDIEEKLYFDFRPDSVSPARGIADPTVAAQYPLDLSGRSRLADGAPDAGAYEWHPTAE